MKVRSRGLLMVVGGAAIYVVLFVFILKGGLGDPAHGGPFKLILIALPGALCLAGLIELATGIPFQRVASAWDDLKGWQRGVLGVLIVIVAFVVMMAGMIAFA